nr:hypothetical protein [Tanacetum cinerariifolium]
MLASSSSSIHDEVEGTRKEGSVTLRYPLLTKTNYFGWAIKMRVNLQAQGVWDATQREGVEERQDRMALAAIYQAITEDVLLMLADKDTAKEAWETLRTMHMGADRVKEAVVQTLRSIFEVIRIKDRESVDEFLMKLNTIVTGIRSLGDTIEEITVNMTVEEVVGGLKTHEERLRGYGDQQREKSLLLTHAEWSTRSKRTDERLVRCSKKKRRVCPGKETQIPFPEQAVFLAQKPLELVHADLCGPITPINVGGSKYFLLLVDDFCRWSWVYMLTEKFEAFDAFKWYTKMVEQSSCYKIKTLRTNQGGEFTSKDFAKFCEKNGIARHLTAQYLPQQTGVVERENRTGMEMAWILLKGRNVLGEFQEKKMMYFGVEDGTKGNRLYDPQDKKLWPYPEDVQANSDPKIAALDPFSLPSTHSRNSPNATRPRGFRSLNDIYARTHEVTLEPEELMMAEMDQP